jgi:hypothetical protein
MQLVQQSLCQPGTRKDYARDTAERLSIKFCGQILWADFAGRFCRLNFEISRIL